MLYENQQANETPPFHCDGVCCGCPYYCDAYDDCAGEICDEDCDDCVLEQYMMQEESEGNE
jgi:hypothetical protein